MRDTDDEDADGDYTFGSGDDFGLINSPEAVAQAVKRDSDCGMGNGFSVPPEGTPRGSVRTR